MNNNSDSFVKPLSQITICVDSKTLAIYKAHAEMTGENYQTLMNEALKQFASSLTLVDMLDETIRQEDA
jgi:uncharacterized protein (DUF4415 family)